MSDKEYMSVGVVSGKKRTFLAIDVSYPKICTYPEYEGKPYYGIKYLEDGETILGFGTYKPEVLSEYLRNYFMPSAEPERKKGTWIYDTERIMHDGWIYNQYHCSLCNYQVIGGLQNFCPNCGAYMRGE